MRIKLSEKFQNEREDICNKIITLLELKEDNTFLLYDLDEDIEKQNKIMELKNDIQKYFACSTISSFKPNFECKRPYLNEEEKVRPSVDFTEGNASSHRILE